MATELEILVDFGGQPVTDGMVIPMILAQEKLNLYWYRDSFLKTIIVANVEVVVVLANLSDQIRPENFAVPYRAPSLPGSYSIGLYRQAGSIELRYQRREIFNTAKFVTDHHLILIESVGFSIAPEAADPPDPPDEISFKTDTSLDQHQQAYCRCLLEVAAQQPETCNTEKAWFEKREGKMCYNPYAICHKSVGAGIYSCSPHYNFDAMSDRYLVAYADLHGVVVPKPYNRAKLLGLIKGKI